VFIAQVIGAVAAAALLAGLVLALAQARTLAKWIALAGLAIALGAGALAIVVEVEYRDCKEWNAEKVRYAAIPGGSIIRGDSPQPRRCERDL
jgi:uncharacterized membrane protein YebE (DUF533 family)